jgi:xanthine/uracil/vitamin C permease (AzgA family)
MNGRAVWIYIGLFILGIVLTSAGAVITPPASFVFPGPIHEAGQSLIAIGLTLILISIGLVLAGLEERMMPTME